MAVNAASTFDGGTPVVPEVLHWSDRTCVTRVPSPAGAGATAIRKETRGRDATARVRHEASVLERLAGTPGVHGLVQRDPGGTALLLDDTGGEPLSAAVRAAGMDPARVLRFARSLAEVVAAVHRRGVIHKDINPSNVLLSDDGAAATLVDFDLATTFAEERPVFTHHSEVGGTLPYLAPEQTGRTGWPVDHRADLYAVGATLYELLTGRPPFGDDTDEPLRLIHAHLARVPAPPSALNPEVPAVLSAIVLRLLEKEPDQRYQSADGLAHDLAWLETLMHEGGGVAPAVEDFRLGDRDFPLRLTAPSRLVGRDAERAALAAAYREARAGGSRGLLVSGAPGVGKSALLDELRGLVTEQGGWLVTGKFDQYRQDVAADGLPQVFPALGSLLLAEPEDRLAAHRDRLLATLGANAGVVAVWPELRTLLGVAPEPPAGDAAEVRSRIQRACVDLLRGVATPERPVVLVLDDLQWAGEFSLGMIDALLVEDDLAGVLVVGAYRDAEVDAVHPLTAMLGRWERLGAAPTRLSLGNLPPGDLATMLAEMLRVGGDEAAALAGAIGARTAGNPFDTVELVNALRRDGVLAPDETGWRWDAGAIRRFVGSSDVLDLLAARIERLPAETGRLLAVMACLSGEITPDVLAVAAGLREDDVRDRLAPALEDGLLVAVSSFGAGEPSRGGSIARFRHDRVQQAAHDHLSPGDRRELHLSLARRLAASELWAPLAAEQYLHAIAAVADPDEARRVAELFLAAGARLKVVNAAAAERYLTAAMSLLPDPAADPATGPATGPAARPGDLLAGDVRAALHEVLCALGRIDDAQRLFDTIAAGCADPLDLVGPAGVQISGLWVAGRMADSLALGIRTLSDLGLDLPAPDEIGAEIGRGLADLRAWVELDDRAGDLTRPEIDDPRWIAIAGIVHRVMPSVFACDEAMMAWLILRARRIWAELGPCEHLVGPLAWAGMLTVAAQDDYRTGHRAVQRVLAVAEARGYEPMTSQARYVHAINNGLWFEPLEDVVALARRSRERFLRLGDLAHAVFTYVGALPLSFEILPTLDQFLAETTAGVAFTARIGNPAAGATLVSIGQLGRAMRGETHEPGGFTDDAFDEAAYLEALAPFPVPLGHFHAHRALAAMVFGDEPALVHHAKAAMDLAPRTPAAFCVIKAHLLHGLAAALRLQRMPAENSPENAPENAPENRADLLAELDACRDWLAARAEDAPATFGHLVRLLEAERAWAVGDFREAALGFDDALARTRRQVRPWQQALTAERAALFHLDQGLELAGTRLLAEAYRCYDDWGATGKVRRLEETYPFLRDDPGWWTEARPDTARGSRGTRGFGTSTTSESLDLVGVLRAAQALASETNPDRLRDRVVEVLTMMTGATGVQLAQWKDDAGDWFVPEEGEVAPEDVTDDVEPAGDGRLLSVDEAARRGLLPVSAFRYAERTGEPLRVDDATRDDRFARDPYLAGLERCSLLVVPIQSHGRTRAMLVLENRLSRGAFSADRLDAVMLIAGQLAVCLDNALAERFRSLVQRSSDLTLVCDGTGTVSYASTAAVELLGVEPTALVGRSAGDVVSADDRDGLLAWVAGAAAGEASDPLVCRLEPRPRAERAGEPRDRQSDRQGDERWAELTVTDLSTDPAVGGLMLRLRDVTERQLLERALEQLAVTDALTGMANRRRFDAALLSETDRSLRTGRPLTLLLLDIDHFKWVNDTYGHPAGDAVIQAVAARCRAAVRDVDLVARVGGEEFAVLLVDVALDEGEQIADRMRKTIEAARVDLPGHPPASGSAEGRVTLSRTVSIGVAQYDGDAQDVMARADAALYRAKASGRNQVSTSP